MRWNLDPVIHDFGPVAIRWYGLCFVIGLFLGVRALDSVFKRRGYPKKHGETLSLLLPLGMIVFAHLVHLLFYETEAFWEEPMRIIEIGKGLSSHGGTFGVIFALWIFCRWKKVSFLEYADPVCVAAAVLAPWVRIGNFCNSEIVGRTTDVPWGIVFERVSPVARHPSQLYEALLGFALIGVAYWFEKRRDRFRPGTTLFVVLGIYFAARFGLEYFKRYQTLSPDFPFTMGQLLSVPAVLVFAGLLWYRGVKRA